MVKFEIFNNKIKNFSVSWLQGQDLSFLIVLLD